MKKSLLAAGAAMSVLWGAGLAQAQEPPFSQVVVFGDSLSDTGNVATLNGLATLNSFTTNPGDVAVEVVAENYGLSVNPSLQGGTNRAYGGAGFNNNAFGTPSSIPTLTTQVAGYLAANPTLDPNALYVLFGGGNDVNFAATNLVLGVQTLAQAQAAMTAAGNQAITLLNGLQAAGAGTVIVVNVPDVGLTPSARGADAISPGSSTRITGLTRTLNDTLNAGLAGRRGVVPVNAFLLLQETVNNADAFGLTDVTSTACTTSSSLNCTGSTLRAPNADSTFLFADGIHPTTAGHLALGEYILSELAAPQRISLLAEQPLGIADAARGAIGFELAAPVEEGARAFAHLSFPTHDYGRQNDIPGLDAVGGVVTIGGVWALNGLSVGAAFSAAKTEADFDVEAGGFETDAQIVSAFGRMGFGQGGYAAAQAQLGRLSFDDVERRIVLGANQRSEQGETDGRLRGLSLSGGYWFDGGPWRHGPVVSATYQEVRVDGYSEKADNSTTMRFGAQDRESMVLEAGWAIQGVMDGPRGELTPFAALTYNVESEDDARLVDAGLVTMNGTFSMPGFTPNSEWVAVKAGVSADLGGAAALKAAYAGRFGDNQDDHAFTVGVSMTY